MIFSGQPRRLLLLLLLLVLKQITECRNPFCRSATIAAISLTIRLVHSATGRCHPRISADRWRERLHGHKAALRGRLVNGNAVCVRLVRHKHRLLLLLLETVIHLGRW